jgi:VWFA-related protein
MKTVNKQVNRQRALRMIGAAAFLVTLFAGQSAVRIFAQQVDETIKVRTRVVFMDALVKNKRTGASISDLNPENFQVMDDGKPRTISYFTREGQARKPLALVLVLDLRDDGAGRFLKRDEVRRAMIDELAKLPPGDEIAILALNINNGDSQLKTPSRLWLTGFTRDQAQLTAALDRVPALVEPPKETKSEAATSKPTSAEKETKTGADDKSDGDRQDVADTGKPKSKDDDIVETETIKGKDGAVVTRTVQKDGSVNVKRVSSNGKITIDLDDYYDMAAAARDVTHLAAEQRPSSQTALVWLSDGIAPIFYEDRDATEQILIRENAIFNSLTVDLRTLYKFLLPIGRPIAGWMGMSLYGSAKSLAQQSGGEAVHVARAKDYGTGLAQIVGNLTARYTLGFAIGQDEKDDGRMHQLDVRVNVLDAKGKARKLVVSSRHGYYWPKSEGVETATSRSSN